MALRGYDADDAIRSRFGLLKRFYLANYLLRAVVCDVVLKKNQFLLKKNAYLTPKNQFLINLRSAFPGVRSAFEQMALQSSRPKLQMSSGK